MPLHPGDVLKGRYIIESFLDGGGMGAVYRAHDSLNKTFCALKELQLDYLPAEEDFTRFRAAYDEECPPRGAREAAIALFQREAQLLAKLEHHNLPKVFDYFEENDKYYLAMTLIQGENLADKMGADSDQPLPERQVLEWMDQVMEALDYCHKNKVVHRDVKPANIIVTSDRKVFLVDFGIARPDNPGGALSRSVQIISEGYSPLEQYSSGPADARSDIYSTGATMYHLLTGKVPLDARRRGAGQEELPSPRAIVRTVSLAVNMAIMKAMELRLDRRFQTIEEFRRALRRKRWERKRLAVWLCLVLALALGANLAFRWNMPAVAFIQAFAPGLFDPTATTEMTIIPPASRTVESTLVMLGSPAPTQSSAKLPTDPISSPDVYARAPILAPIVTLAPTRVPATGSVPPATDTAAPIQSTATKPPPATETLIRATVTLLPSATLEPSATPILPTARPVPTRAPTAPPTAVPTRPKAANTATRPSTATMAGVTVMVPAAGATLQGSVMFQWRDAPGFALGPGDQYELIFWKPGQDPMRDGCSPVGASKYTSLMIDMASLERVIGLTPGSNFWGVRLWGTTGAIRMLSEARPFTYERAGGGDAPPTWTPPEP